MGWRNALQIAEELSEIFDDSELALVRDFYALHRFLKGALPTKDAELSPRFRDAISISAYGRETLSTISLPHSENDLSLAALLVFFHHELMIDIHNSDITFARETLATEFERGTLRLANRFGRALYDKFGDLSAESRIEHLTADRVDLLLKDAETGIYQVGKITIGALGILDSQEARYYPPARKIPLWHCSDPGCEKLHDVELLQHPTTAYRLAEELERNLKRNQGPASEWMLPISRIGLWHKQVEQKSYYDAFLFLAECLSPTEFDTLTERALIEKTGIQLRDTLKSNAHTKTLRGSATDLVKSLDRSQKLQLLMGLTDDELESLIDNCVHDDLVKIPATEIRQTKTQAPKLFNYCPTSSLSNLGLRPNRERPIIFLATTIWNEYKKANLLSELAWRCRKGDITPALSAPLEYIRSYSAREAVRNLILPSANITMAIAEKLRLSMFQNESHDDLTERLLWKFGFSSARYDKKYTRFKAQLEQFRSELLRSPFRLTDDDRDAIRSKGVNVFVSLENFIEELVAYNVWILASDHFGNTKFEYKSEMALAKVADVLGNTKLISNQTIVWRPEGGNTLGTLLVYARAAADWMSELLNADKSGLIRHQSEYPHFANDPDRRFPFEHRALWADTPRSELKAYVEQFNDLIEKIERSRLAEVRNGLDHYRDPDEFPTSDLMMACQNWLSAVFDISDEKRFIPKAYWLIRRESDEYGLIRETVEDYAGRKIELEGPSVLSGIPRPDFHRPALIPHGNLLGDSPLVLYLTEESDYSQIWKDYPRRGGAKN